jgi:hypothetical protein
VLVLLKTPGKDRVEVEKDLRRLLPLKTKAEYDPNDIPLSTAQRRLPEDRNVSR